MNSAAKAKEWEDEKLSASKAEQQQIPQHSIDVNAIIRTPGDIIKSNPSLIDDKKRPERPHIVMFEEVGNWPGARGLEKKLPTADRTFVLPQKKETNPKDSIGIKKVPASTIPGPVLLEVGLGMLEGACKYGRHNYRKAGVRASVYYDATQRHLLDWWEGTDVDPDSGLNHITKAIASLVVLRDSMIRENWTDDRPPKTPEGWLQNMNVLASNILNKYPNPVPAFTEKEI